MGVHYRSSIKWPKSGIPMIMIQKLQVSSVWQKILGAVKRGDECTQHISDHQFFFHTLHTSKINLFGWVYVSAIFMSKKVFLSTIFVITQPPNVTC
jgi:hypothetical protein